MARIAAGAPLGDFVYLPASIEMTENAVEFRQIDVGNTGVAPNQQHVFIVVDQRRTREVGRTGADQRIVRERVDQQEFRMNEIDMPLVGGAYQLFVDEPFLQV